jgi:hypothetical protein
MQTACCIFNYFLVNYVNIIDNTFSKQLEINTRRIKNGNTDDVLRTYTINTNCAIIFFSYWSSTHRLN